MSKSACKCKKPGECEECPEWIFTFADLVMLMMGFFVIRWVLKPSANPQTNPEAAQQADDKFTILEGKIREGFGWEPKPSSQDPFNVKLRDAMNRTLTHPGPG